MKFLARALPVAAALEPAAHAAPAESPAPLPARLSDTGLYASGSATQLGERVLAFEPQYPLWSDGTRKRRWILLPPGTGLWKEFGYDRPIETRYIERLADGRWRFAAYVWSADGREAVLAAEGGAVLDAGPAGRYVVPARTDCLACHEGPAVPVLGFSALQLSPDRDPLAPHAGSARNDWVDLRRLVSQRLVVNLPPALLAAPPRIEAPTPTARAALGYLHGNCGHCHATAGALDGSSPSTLLLRMRAGNSLARMPPLGVQLIDTEGVALIEHWIREQQHNPQETKP